MALNRQKEQDHHWEDQIDVSIFKTYVPFLNLMSFIEPLSITTCTLPQSTL